jgi:hypothetical protein
MDNWRPVADGHLPRLAAAFTRAEAKARELGLIGDRGADDE